MLHGLLSICNIMLCRIVKLMQNVCTYDNELMSAIMPSLTRCNKENTL